MIDPRRETLPDYALRSMSLERLRLVWAAVSAEPQAPVRRLARQLAMSPTLVVVGLQRLAHAGYITYEPHLPATRRIIVPFVTVVAALPQVAPGYEQRRQRRKKTRLAA